VAKTGYHRMVCAVLKSAITEWSVQCWNQLSQNGLCSAETSYHRMVCAVLKPAIKDGLCSAEISYHRMVCAVLKPAITEWSVQCWNQREFNGFKSLCDFMEGCWKVVFCVERATLVKWDILFGHVS
jgi:hypothetical protein